MLYKPKIGHCVCAIPLPYRAPMISLPLHSPCHEIPDFWGKPILKALQPAGLCLPESSDLPLPLKVEFPPSPWCPSWCPHTVHAHRGIPPNILCSFQKMCLDHSTTVGTRKAALKVAFKVVNWWRCQHIVFIPKSWSLFWDHLRASKVCPLARKISVLWALLQILSTCHKGNV